MTFYFLSFTRAFRNSYLAAKCYNLSDAVVAFCSAEQPKDLAEGKKTVTELNLSVSEQAKSTASHFIARTQPQCEYQAVLWKYLFYDVLNSNHVLRSDLKPPQE